MSMMSVTLRAMAVICAFSATTSLGDIYLEEAFTVLQSRTSFSGIAPAMEEVKAITTAISSMTLDPKISDQVERRLLRQLVKATESLLGGKSARTLRKMKSTLPQARYKRSWDGLGNFWHGISGAPGPREWKRNLNVLRHVKKALRSLTSSTSDLITSDVNQNEALLTHQRALLVIRDGMRKQADEFNSMHSTQRAALFVERLSTTANFALETVKDLLDIVDRAVEKGQNHQISNDLIPVQEIAQELARINKAEKTLRPIFREEEIPMYYLMPFGEAWWVGDILVSALKIPLVNPAEPLTVEDWPHAADVLRNRLQAAGMHSMIYAVCSDKRAYQLIDDSDRNCHAFGVNKLCGYRSARILRDESCDRASCAFGYSIVYERVPNSFWFVLGRAVEATLRCNTTTRKVRIGKEAIVTVPSTCSLEHNLFYIPSRHLAAIATEVITTRFAARHIKVDLQQHEIEAKILRFDVDLEKAALAIQLSSEDIIQANETNINTINTVNQISFVGWVGGGTLTCVVAALVITCVSYAFWKCGCCGAMCRCCCSACNKVVEKTVDKIVEEPSVKVEEPKATPKEEPKMPSYIELLREIAARNTEIPPKFDTSSIQQSAPPPATQSASASAPVTDVSTQQSAVSDPSPALAFAFGSGATPPAYSK